MFTQSGLTLDPPLKFNTVGTSELYSYSSQSTIFRRYRLHILLFASMMEFYLPILWSFWCFFSIRSCFHRFSSHLRITFILSHFFPLITLDLLPTHFWVAHDSLMFHLIHSCLSSSSTVLISMYCWSISIFTLDHRHTLDLLSQLTFDSHSAHAHPIAKPFLIQARLTIDRILASHDLLLSSFTFNFSSRQI